MQYLGLRAFNERGNGFVNDRHVEIAVMGISLISYGMQYLGLTAFNELDDFHCFVDDDGNELGK